MKSQIFTVLFLLFTSKIVHSQLRITDVRDMAMGNASVASMQESGISGNNAIILPGNKFHSTTGVLNNYSMPVLSPVFISCSKSFRENFSIHGGAASLGNEFFRQQSFEAGIAKKLGTKFCAGIKVNYNIWTLNDSYYEKSSAFIPAICLFANPLKNLCFGAIILNPVRSGMNAIERNRLPAKINSGIAYRVSGKLQLACAIIQQSNLPLSTQLGIEYNFHPRFTLRFGWHTLPVSETFGFALKLSKFSFDFALQTHPVLGNSTAVGLNFEI